VPSDFDPGPKSLKHWKTLKGKELRRFLNYDGFVTMWLVEQELPDQHKGVFTLFLKLACGIRILGDESLCGPYNEDAKTLLDQFKEESVNMLGEHFVVFVVHTLSHLADDCKLHGHLDNFSAYL